MRQYVLASAALGALATLAFGQTAEAAVTYAYAGTDDVWDLSFTYTSATPIDHDSYAVVPCADNHGDTSCTLSFYLAGTPSYLNPLNNEEISQDNNHDILGVFSTGGPGGSTTFGCCIGFELALDAGALTHDGVYQSEYSRGAVTVSGIPAASGAPEPAAWALMILGFGSVGAALRRRQLRLA